MRDKNEPNRPASGRKEAVVDKPLIAYPCEWSYKVIGADRGLIADAIADLLEPFDAHFHESRQSRTGRFTSFEVTVQVETEAERNAIFDGLRSIPSVKLVL